MLITSSKKIKQKKNQVNNHEFLHILDNVRTHDTSHEKQNYTYTAIS